ncbi:MAG: monovalent cation/H(+) antiporter subunit G, partial [Desulfobacterales bacterium]
MNEILISALLVIGSFFMLVAGLGMLRMPDLLLRMSCSTKAATIGVGTMLLALALYFENLGVATRAL